MKINFSFTVIIFILTSTMASSVAHSQPADSSQIRQVWFSPNAGSVDMLNLFTNPEQWESARLKVNVFKFYVGQLTSQGGARVGSNTLSNLADVQAFSKLNQWNIDIAIESMYSFPPGSEDDIPPELCAAEIKYVNDQAISVTKNNIQNIQSNGGVVKYLAIDEPIRKWYSKVYTSNGQDKPDCSYDSLSELANDVDEYIRQINSTYPTIIIGQIILYPEVRVSDIKEWVIELETRNVSIAFIHLDVHGDRIDSYNNAGMNIDVAADLLELESFLANHNIGFGIIFSDLRWQSRNPYNDSIYYDSTLVWISTVKSAIGEPDHSIFQSWVLTPVDSMPEIDWKKEIPINLPENDFLIYSHTRLINEGLEILNSPITGVTDPPTGLPEKFELQQNYPNPFNPETTIRYSVVNPSHVQITIYNTIGQLIRTLVNEQKAAGNYRVVWNGRDENSRSVASGVYIYSMRAAGQALQRKLVILR